MHIANPILIRPDCLPIVLVYDVYTERDLGWINSLEHASFRPDLLLPF